MHGLSLADEKVIEPMAGQNITLGNLREPPVLIQCFGLPHGAKNKRDLWASAKAAPLQLYFANTPLLPHASLRFATIHRIFWPDDHFPFDYAD
jgi:hypothetical protein